MTLCPDEADQAQAYRRPDQPGLEVEGHRDQEGDDEQCGRGGRIGEGGRHQPVTPGVLGQGVPVPQHARHARRRREGADGHDRHEDPGPVVAPNVADHQEGGQEAEYRRAQGEEGRHALCRGRPIEPPGRQPSHRDQHRERDAVRPAPKGGGHQEEGHDHDTEGVERVEGAPAVDRGGGHADHNGRQRRRAELPAWPHRPPGRRVRRGRRGAGHWKRSPPKGRPRRPASGRQAPCRCRPRNQAGTCPTPDGATIMRMGSGGHSCTTAGAGQLILVRVTRSDTGDGGA